MKTTAVVAMVVLCAGSVIAQDPTSLAKWPILVEIVKETDWMDVFQNVIVPIVATLLGCWIANRHSAKQQQQQRISEAVQVYMEFGQLRNRAREALDHGEAGIADGSIKASQAAIRSSLAPIMRFDSRTVRAGLALNIVETLKEMAEDANRGDLVLMEKHGKQEELAFHDLQEGIQELLDRLSKLPKARVVEQKMASLRARQEQVMRG